MNRALAAIVSVTSVAVAGIVGGSYGPQQPRAAVWYASLRKPPFTPPGPVIGVTWGVLEMLLCFTGYRLMTKPAGNDQPIALVGWVATLGCLAGYPATFFGKRKLVPSAAVATAMLVSTSATAAASVHTDRSAALAMTPLVVWTSFAVLLSEELWRRNH
jgi:tryptophan-rich sensory protein